MGKRVCIIGAGASGLPAIKCCLEENLEPTCYERSDDIGGLWRYTDDDCLGKASVFKSTIINTSKEMMCYSDYPIPAEFPNFMHNTYILDYFRRYSDQFNLRKYINFGYEVLRASQSDDFASTGRWIIQTKNLNSGEEKTEFFDFLIVATGHHAEPNFPSFPGLDTFKGTVVHSHFYKTPSVYEDTRVLIIGIGNSALDAAAELSRMTRRCFLSTRRGTWLLHRVDEKGMPIDLIFSRRILNFVKQVLPDSWLCNFAEAQLNKKFDHEMYSLKPEHRFFSQHPAVNDEIPNRILSGGVTIKPDVRAFTENGVTFEDGTYEEIDKVLVCTGYNFGFPFLDKSVIDVNKNQVDLFMWAFPPDLVKHTLVVLGYIQPLGAINPISELQCRLAVRVFTGQCSLPSRTKMWSNIVEKKREMRERYVESQRHTIQVDWIPFMDELAELNGCKPNLLQMVVTDPHLWYNVLFGPTYPYHYRLTGPGKWKGARQAILTALDRVKYPLATRTVKSSPKSRSTFASIFMIVVFLLFAYFAVRCFF